MDINTIDTLFPCHKKIFEASCEQSIDTDFTLPDYYPEVSKILKALIDVNILSKQIKDDSISIGGQVCITLLYCDAENRLNSFNHICPFTKILNEKIDCDGAVLSVIPVLNHINCKATAPRKLEVHGSVSMNISACTIEKNKVLSEINADNVYTKKITKSLTQPSAIVTKSLIVEDDISVGQNKPNIEKIIRSCATSKIIECKFINGKAVVKGEICVEILYMPVDMQRPTVLSDVFGFSQILDCDGIDENSMYDAFSDVLSLETRTKTSIDGEIKSVAFEAKIGIELHPYCTKENEFVTDAFATKYNMELIKNNITIETVKESINENYVCKKMLDFTEGMLNEIHNLWCKSTVDYVTFENGDVVIKGTVYINILGANSENEPTFYERPVDYEYRYTLGSDITEIRCKPSVNVAAVNYSLNSDGRVDVAIELNIKATFFVSELFNVVTQITIDDNNVLSNDCNAAVVIYFPENETVWQIAKKYCVSPSKICQTNNLEDIDSVCCKMLLIPNE